jgi:hypothetical protein
MPHEILFESSDGLLTGMSSCDAAVEWLPERFNDEAVLCICLPPSSISVVALYMYIDGTAGKSTPEQADKILTNMTG